jgi:hypothetical protein
MTFKNTLFFIEKDALKGNEKCFNIVGIVKE